MIAVDTNILVCAHREEVPAHAAARAELTWLAEGVAPWGYRSSRVGEFVRVVTHPRVFVPPSTTDQALRFIDALIESPRLCRLGTDEHYVRLSFVSTP